MRSLFQRTCALSVLATAALVAAEGTSAAQSTGPSTSQSPYALPSPSAPGVQTTSILSVGDAIGGYRMVGIPDGLGAFDNLDGTFTLVMNHELGNTLGINRAHGARGAFVSRWVIEKATLRVLSGADLMQQLFRWDVVSQAPAALPTTFAFNRFCSGDLPEASAFFNAATGLGTQARIYLHGEEGGSTGIQLGTVVTGPDAGKAYELGKFNLKTDGSGGVDVGAWENSVAAPFAQDKTVVVATNDGGTGIMTNTVSVYVGTKQTTGTEVDKAGLNNGAIQFVNVLGNPLEIVNTTSRATNITSGTRFTLSAATSTTFSRPEDAAWNPLDPRQVYFVTTDQLDQVSDGVGAQIGQTRLWRLTFDDITHPDLGGTIDLLIDGRFVDGQKVNMFDNITVNPTTGIVLLDEDVGNAAHNGKVWAYDPVSNGLVRILNHDSSRFGDVTSAATAPFNRDEEMSGVLDVSAILGPNMYLTSDQAHYAINATTPNGFTNPDELVEGGQLLAIRVAAAQAQNVPALPLPWLALCATLVAGTGIVLVRRTRWAAASQA